MISLLREDPDFRREMYEILSESFVIRNEVKEILKELKILREDFNHEMNGLREDFLTLSTAKVGRFCRGDSRFVSLGFILPSSGFVKAAPAMDIYPWLVLKYS